jgi:hypothetical protein
MCRCEELPTCISLLGAGVQDTALPPETEPVAENLMAVVQDENCVGIQTSQRLQYAVQE